MLESVRYLNRRWFTNVDEEQERGGEGGKGQVAPLSHVSIL